MKYRPFRAPHHNASLNALIGGGAYAMPGEVSLAHNGVLFLDELAEFSRRTLDALRQPIEDKKVSISRVNGTHTFPSSFMFITAMSVVIIQVQNVSVRIMRSLNTGERSPALSWTG